MRMAFPGRLEEARPIPVRKFPKQATVLALFRKVATFRAVNAEWINRCFRVPADSTVVRRICVETAGSRDTMTNARIDLRELISLAPDTSTEKNGRAPWRDRGGQT